MSIESSEVLPPKEINNEVSVSLRIGDLSAEFRGSPDSVIRSVNSFLSKEIPAYSLAKKLLLKFSAAELVEKFADYVRFAPEGPFLLTSDKKLSDRQLVALRLVAQEIAFETGATGSNSLSNSDLQESIALNPKTISSRLSELSKLGSVIRLTESGTTRFRISTSGINSLIEDFEKKRKVTD
jgi:hypothetical protein